MRPYGDRLSSRRRSTPAQRRAVRRGRGARRGACDARRRAASRHRCCRCTTRSTARRWRRSSSGSPRELAGRAHGAAALPVYSTVTGGARRRRARSTPRTSAATCASRCASPTPSARWPTTASTSSSRSVRIRCSAASIAECLASTRTAPPRCSRRCAAAGPSARRCCRPAPALYAAGAHARVGGASSEAAGDVVSICRHIRGSASATGCAASGAHAPARRSRRSERRIRCLGRRLRAAGIDVRTSSRAARWPRQHWLADHRIFGRLLMPAAARARGVRAPRRDRCRPDAGAAARTSSSIARCMLPEEGDAAGALADGRRRGRSDGALAIELLRGRLAAGRHDSQRAPRGQRLGATHSVTKTPRACGTNRSASIAPDCLRALRRARRRLRAELALRARRVARSRHRHRPGCNFPQTLESEAASTCCTRCCSMPRLQLCSVAAVRPTTPWLRRNVLLPLGADRVDLCARHAARLRGTRGASTRRTTRSLASRP